MSMLACIFQDFFFNKYIYTPTYILIKLEYRIYIYSCNLLCSFNNILLAHYNSINKKLIIISNGFIIFWCMVDTEYVLPLTCWWVFMLFLIFNIINNVSVNILVYSFLFILSSFLRINDWVGLLGQRKCDTCCQVYAQLLIGTK